MKKHEKRAKADHNIANRAPIRSYAPSKGARFSAENYIPRWTKIVQNGHSLCTEYLQKGVLALCTAIKALFRRHIDADGKVAGGQAVPNAVAERSQDHLQKVHRQRWIGVVPVLEQSVDARQKSGDHGQCVGPWLLKKINKEIINSDYSDEFE